VFAAQMMIRVEFHEAAEAELKKALALDATLPRTHYLLGEIAIHFARIDEGIALFRKELEVNPMDPMAHYRLGEAYARQQKWDPAIAALQRSLWINPYYSGPLIVLGRAYLAKTQPAVAEGLLRRATEYDPNNKSAHYLLAQALQKLGRTEEADKEFAIAAKLSDSSATR
jgi:tetratricopeptide (TPR) repeat protein